MATREEQIAQAQEDLDAKIRLERTFRPEVKSVFARMLRAFAATVARNGNPPQANTFLPEWEGVLRKHFDRVQRSFSGSVVGFNGKSLDRLLTKQEDEGEDDSVFPFALLAWIDQNAPKDAAQIVSTSQANFSDALQQAREILQEEGEPFGNRDLSLNASAILKKKLSGREEAIVSFETQSAAESTKLIEAEIASGLEPSILVPVGFGVSQTLKTWTTIGDSKVRVEPFNHRAANGQIRRITEPFEVSGQFLMHPGDTSRGASAGNVINCRCSAIYTI